MTLIPLGLCHYRIQTNANFISGGGAGTINAITQLWQTRPTISQLLLFLQFHAKLAALVLYLWVINRTCIMTTPLLNTCLKEVIF